MEKGPNNDFLLKKHMKCNRCVNLNKAIIQKACGAYRYGCSIKEDGYMSTWINNDRLLGLIGCDEQDKNMGIKYSYPVQLTLDDFLQK